MRQLKQYLNPWPFIGAIAALGFAPLFWWPITLGALGYLLYHLKQNITQPHSWVLKKTWLFGFGFCFIGLWWVGGALRFTPFISSAHISFLLGAITTLALSAVMALWFSVPFLLAHKPLQILNKYHKSWFAPFLLTGLWVGVEAIRATTPYGFAWNLLGHTLAGHDVLIQPAALGGVWLLSAAIILLPATCVWCTSKKNFMYALLYIFPLFMVFSWGGWRLWQAPPLVPFAHVTLLQPNISQNIKWQRDPILAATALVDMLNIPKTQQELPQLIAFPETALTFIDPNHTFMQSALQPYLQNGVGVAYGAPTHQEGHYHNSLVALHQSRPPQVFNKEFLVPFGEMTPLRQYFPDLLKKIIPKGYAPGHNNRRLSTHIGTALPLICFEALFPFALKEAQKQHHPKFIINVTNDAWFDNTTGPAQHLAIARLRSVETGLSQIRIANTGISGVIDGYGRLVKRSKTEHSVQIDSPIFEQVFLKKIFGTKEKN